MCSASCSASHNPISSHILQSCSDHSSQSLSLSSLFQVSKIFHHMAQRSNSSIELTIAFFFYLRWKKIHVHLNLALSRLLLFFDQHLLVCFTVLVKCKDVHQQPEDLLCRAGDEKVEISCSHTIKSYDTILWYQQTEVDTAMKLIGYVSYTSIKSIEAPWKNVFNVSGNGEEKASLHFSFINTSLSAVYFCAAYYYAQHCKCPTKSNKN